MEKWLLPFVVLVLTALACGRGNPPAEWQPQSNVLPQTGTQPLPRLFIQPTPGDGTLTLLDPLTAETRTETWTRAANLSVVLAGDYQVVGDVLAGGGGAYFGLSGGTASPNGLWLAAEEPAGLRLFRVDGAATLLSPSGQFPVWSPDGDWLAYRDEEGLWVVNVRADLTPQRVSTTAYEPLAWAADHRQLFVRNGATAVVFDLPTQQPITLRGVDARQVRGHPAWAADGETIIARYGNNGLLTPDAAHRQPDNIQARLVAIALDGSRNPVRDVLPDQRDGGVSEFLLSPDGLYLVARHFRCSTAFGSGLFPFIPQRGCEGSLLLVETATGHYQTVPGDFLTGAMAWEQPLPPVQLADLPLPGASEPPSGLVSSAGGHPFWVPDAAPGQNPATAFPLGQAGERLGTLTTILAVIDGEAALELARTANTDPPLLAPSPGYVYVAVRQQVTTNGSGSAGMYLSSRNLLVDDRLAAHTEMAWLDTSGQALQEVRFSAATPAEYWQVFVLEADARPWLLYSPAGADNQPDLYYRLEEGAAWEVPAPVVSDLSPNQAGVSEPARVGETSVSSNWQVTILPGDPSELPALASELVQVQIAYTGSVPKPNRLLICLGSGAFQDAAGGTVVLDVPKIALPFQSYYRTTCLLPGGLFRGWLAVLPGSGGETIFRFNPPDAAPMGERLFGFP